MTRPGGMAGASTWRMRYQDSSVKNKKLSSIYDQVPYRKTFVAYRVSEKKEKSRGGFHTFAETKPTRWRGDFTMTHEEQKMQARSISIG